MKVDSFSPGGNGIDLLVQFQNILEGDKLIDEIGFLHPSQFSSLDENPSDSPPSLTAPIQFVDDTPERNAVKTVQLGQTIFWNRNHKLGISTDVLSPLYIAARHAYVEASERYKASIKLSMNRGAIHSAVAGDDFDHFTESEILRHTKAVLILSCNLFSAWNIRRLVLLRKHDISLFFNELYFSTLILSYASKCEYAWSQRRWVIKMVGEKWSNLEEIINEESKLVEKIAEKSKMNYRAWSHRCWLISYMKSAQVLHEFDKSKRWAELHVADNCCFHYRRQLMARLLEDNHLENVEDAINGNYDIFSLWKEELKWTELLIRRYVGREALWTHRRFLAQCWITHLASKEAVIFDPEDLPPASSATETFLAKELRLLKSCLNTADGFDDTRDQAECAARYFLWILKFFLPQDSKHEELIMEIREIKPVLLKASPGAIQCCQDILD